MCMCNVERRVGGVGGGGAGKSCVAFRFSSHVFFFRKYKGTVVLRRSRAPRAYTYVLLTTV